MRKYLFILMVLLLASPLQAQLETDSIWVRVNNLEMHINNVGSVLPGGAVYPPGTNGSLLFSGDVGLTGYIGGELRSAWQLPKRFVEERQPGVWGEDPADPDARIYVVRSSDGPDSPAYVNWAKAVEQGADFIDVNGDGIYEPGVDRPDIIGDFTAFCSFNDNTTLAQRTPRTGAPALGVEIHQSCWAYKEILPDAVFYRYRIINRNTVTLDSVMFSTWVWNSLGNFPDDRIGVDTLLNVGYVYNSDNEAPLLGRTPPSLGLQLLQGAVVEAPGETAIRRYGPQRGKRILQDQKDLGLTSFSNAYLQFSDYVADRIRNVQSGLDEFGDPINPLQWGLGGSVNDNPLFMYSGNPVDSTGWISTFSRESLMLSSGPFFMAPGDTQEIILAYVAGEGIDHIDSITEMKKHAEDVKTAFERNFEPAELDITPFTNARGLQNEISLNFDLNDLLAKTAIPDIRGFAAFEGFSIYQLPEENSSIEDGVEIAGFDLNNMFSDLYTDVDTPNGPELKQFYRGRNNLDAAPFTETGSGVFKLVINRDSLRSEPIYNYRTYHFAIRAFAINPMFTKENELTGQIPDDWIVEYPAFAKKQVLSVTPGIDDNAPYRSFLAEHQVGTSQGSVFAEVLDRNLYSGDDYVVRFFDNGIFWQLVNVATGEVALDSMLYQTVDKPDVFHSAAGLLTAVRNVPHKLQQVDIVDNPGNEVWLQGSGNSNLTEDALFNRGIELAPSLQEKTRNFPLRLDSLTQKQDYIPIRLVVDSLNSGIAYRWRLPSLLDAVYEGMENSYFSAYDMTNPLNPRRLNIAYTYPVAGELPLEQGNLTFVMVLNSDYDATDLYNPVNPNAPDVRDDIYLVMRLERPAEVEVRAGTFELDIIPFYPNSDVDQFLLRGSELTPVLTNSEQRSLLDRVRVVPNPYFAGGGLGNEVRFIHMDKEAAVRIFDLAGTHVITLRKNDDSSQLRWNLRNKSGRKIGSGMFLAHIEVDGIGERVLKFAVVQGK